MTAIVNLTDPLQRGDTLSFELNWDNGAVTPVPLDMRGKTIVLTIKLSNFQEDAEALVTVEATPGAGDTEAQGGSVVLQVPRSMSQNLIAGALHYYAVRVIDTSAPEDIEVTHVSGTVPVVDA